MRYHQIAFCCFLVVACGGSLWAGTPAVTLSPTSLSFGDQLLNTTSSAKQVTMKNTGTATLSIAGISITGDFVISSKSCGSSLGAGSQCAINVTFKPTGKGTRFGALAISDNAAGTPQMVSLTGNGVQSQSVAVAVLPQSGCVRTNSTLQFTVKITGVTNPSATWAVDGAANGNSTVGTISSSGLYTAPGTVGSHTIKATSVSVPSKSGTAAAKVVSSVSVTLYPGNAAALTDQTLQFQATVCGTTATSVNWYVDGILFGSDSEGTITTAGLYTAPLAAGIHTIKAVSTADSSKSASSTVNVFSTVVADFGSRSNTSHRIPAGLVGAQEGFLQDQTTLNILGQAGFGALRLYARIPDVYATTSASWINIDPSISKLKQAGLKPIIMLAFTPSWLQPSPNPCSGITNALYDAAPANISTWAQLAASYVAHFDRTFPGYVQDYEIWNEPDLPTFCVPGNTDSVRLSTYQNLYAATGAALRAQAKVDGVTIRIGGPALSNPTGLAWEWIPGLVSNTSTAPYVDFVSFHEYLGNLTTIVAGMQWDSNDANVQSLYSRTQAGWGPAGSYKNVSLLVKKGLQANPSTTPIYFDEYNDNSSFSMDCCRNSATYSPVWNLLVMADLLDSVYSGASAVPTKTSYYAASAPPYFCLFGAIDTNMDCSTSSLQAYPQFYAFKLLTSTSYLGLSAGGAMAASVSPGITQNGLAVTAFYTSTQDSILIVNPTANTYADVPVFIKNPGFSTAQAESYLLNQSDSHISTSALTLNQVTGGFNIHVAMPPYSVLGISITAQ